MRALLVAGLVLALGLAGTAARGAGGRRATRSRLRARSGPSQSPRQRWNDRPARRQRALVVALPDALDAVARAVRSGSALRVALLHAGEGPAADALATLAATASRGRPLAEACESWAASAPTVELRLAGQALALSASAGGDAARSLDTVVASLRERQALAAEVRAQSAQARLSAMVVGLLPLVFTGWCLVTDPRVAAFLFTSAAGWACLVVGGLLDATGLAWMSRLVRKATP